MGFLARNTKHAFLQRAEVSGNIGMFFCAPWAAWSFGHCSLGGHCSGTRGGVHICACPGCDETTEIIGACLAGVPTPDICPQQPHCFLAPVGGGEWRPEQQCTMQTSRLGLGVVYGLWGAGVQVYG